MILTGTCPFSESIIYNATYHSSIECSLKCLQEPLCAGINYKKFVNEDINYQLIQNLDSYHKDCNNKVWNLYEVINFQRKGIEFANNLIFSELKILDWSLSFAK